MNKIAIFVSGEGRAAERIIKLFNEGNRVKTVVVVADDSAVSLGDRIKDPEVKFIHIPDQNWHSVGQEVAALLKENEVRLIVLDEFASAISDEIMEATNGELVRVTNAELAPKEVVRALEADLHKPVEEKKEEKVEVEENPSPESEWAEALKIQYKPPKVPTTPPEVPGVPGNQESPQAWEPQEIDFSQGNENPNGGNFRYQDYRREEYRSHRRENHEPMPSTFLIWSVLVTVFCCFIPGIIAIIFSSQVSSRYYAGDFEGAKRSSRMAEIWIIVSVVLGVLAATLYLPFMFLS